jgi:hypothetical protein
MKGVATDGVDRGQVFVGAEDADDRREIGQVFGPFLVGADEAERAGVSLFQGE